MARNLVLGFALALGGGILLDAGVKQFKTAEGGASSGVNSAASGPGTSFSPLGNIPGAKQTAGSSTGSSTGLLTANQQAFANELTTKTGLDPNVITAWLLAEESSTAAEGRQAANNNDWLNIGYTDSATYGAADSIWSDPVTAADATAQWLAGADVIPGYGTASSGVRGILSTAGQSPATQISTIQGSGWASGGYPALGEDYDSVMSAVAAAQAKLNAAITAENKGVKKNKIGSGVLAPKVTTIDGVPVTG